MRLDELRELALRLLSENRAYPPGIHILQREAPSSIEAVIYRPVICLILQGAKEVTIGNKTVCARTGDALLVSHDLPVVSKITEASQDKPYLALILEIDLAAIRGLYEQLGDTLENVPDARSLSRQAADPAWMEPLQRYLRLADSQLDLTVVGPLTLREIHYRLLLSPIGGMLRNLLKVDSHASRIAKAILHIRSGFRQPLAIETLARMVGMSTSSFHSHFKSVTGTSPLQYQKDLRLIEAQSLLQGGQHSVASASFEVGYESPTHFSRDFARKFGVPPSRALAAA